MYFKFSACPLRRRVCFQFRSLRTAPKKQQLPENPGRRCFRSVFPDFRDIKQ